jgi:hypothetical protein
VESPPAAKPLGVKCKFFPENAGGNIKEHFKKHPRVTDFFEIDNS